jgi:Cu(I)/Ag(I) efflux system periplasmic protein CusF
MKKTVMMAALIALPFGVAGCDKKAETPEAEPPAEAMGDMAMSAEAKMAKGVGTVTAIDAAAGKITLDHEPISAVDWPAMKMGFSAKPDLLKGVTVGDRVDFDLTVTGNAGEVTAIKKR